MIMWLEQWCNRLKNYDMRDYVKFIAIIGGTVLVITVTLLATYFSLQHKLIQRYNQLNKERTQTASLLSQHARLMQQRATVDQLLEKDPNFKIKPFFSVLIQTLGLQQALTKEPEASPLQDLVRGYGELKLEATLKRISLKQLVELLEKINEQERVYVKEITITKPTSDTTIDVAITLATFERSTTT